MADGRRARGEQVAKRVNTATELLEAGMDVIDATRDLARRIGSQSARPAATWSGPVTRGDGDARAEGGLQGQAPGRVGPPGAPRGEGHGAEHLRAGSAGAVGVLGPPSRPAVAERQVSLEFVFDRAGEQALARAYRLLVPERLSRTVQRKDDDHTQDRGSESAVSSIADDDRRPSAPEASEPVRNVSVTATCGVCGGPLPPGRARRWCSDACRQAAFRLRRAAPRPALPAKADTVYECPSARPATWVSSAARTATAGAGVWGRGGRARTATSLVVLSDFLRPDQLGGQTPNRSATSQQRRRP